MNNSTDFFNINSSLIIHLDDFFPNKREDSKLGDQMKMELIEVLPPPNHEDPQVLVMAGIYMLLFLLGTCGNVIVLTTIYQVVRSHRATLDNTLLYVIVLSCVDFGVCISLPFTVLDQILGFWMFGSGICKLHAVLENFGKILSALIIAAMSFDRYAGVCHPQMRYLRNRKIAVAILIGLAIYALVTLCPLLWSFTAREMILFEKETAPYKLIRMKIEKCTMVNISSLVFTMFIVYQCILCYCIPLFLVAFFYSKLLFCLKKHARQFKSSQIPLARISLYTFAVACFYFLCWTPFWIATVFAVYLEYAEEHGKSVPPIFVYCMYFVHALPFTNSAINWILYGALNSQLQQKIKGKIQRNSDFYNNGELNANEGGTRKAIKNIRLTTEVNDPLVRKQNISEDKRTNRSLINVANSPSKEPFQPKMLNNVQKLDISDEQQNLLRDQSDNCLMINDDVTYL